MGSPSGLPASNNKRAKRALDGCGRWTAGRHFFPWKFGVPGVTDPGKEGFEDYHLDELATAAREGSHCHLDKQRRVAICADDIEKLESYNPRRPFQDREMYENPDFLAVIQKRCYAWFGTTTSLRPTCLVTTIRRMRGGLEPPCRL